jgi:hypothetical protein
MSMRRHNRRRLFRFVAQLGGTARAERPGSDCVALTSARFISDTQSSKLHVELGFDVVNVTLPLLNITLLSIRVQVDLMHILQCFTFPPMLIPCDQFVYLQKANIQDIMTYHILLSYSMHPFHP